MRIKGESEIRDFYFTYLQIDYFKWNFYNLLRFKALSASFTNFKGLEL